LVNWREERQKDEYPGLLRLDKQTVRDYTRRHAFANAEEIPYGEVIDGLLDKGTTTSMIGKWLNKCLERQTGDVTSVY
jgi:hypothetical protein